MDTLGLPINQEACFSYKGNPNPGLMNQQLKTLKPFVALLKLVLLPGEEILLSARACSPMSFLEQYTHGWIVTYLKRCVLVFTNKRILHFPATYNFQARNSVSEIYYGDIKQFKTPSFLSGTLKLTYATGKKEAFFYMQGAKTKKKLKEILPVQIAGGESSSAGERVYLCPSCASMLKKDIFSCPRCQFQFKDGKVAARLSVLYPGGGDFYTGHPILGLLNAAGEIVLAVGLLTAFIAFMDGKPVFGDLLVFGIFIAYEKLVGIYHAKRYAEEYIPAEKSFTPYKAG